MLRRCAAAAGVPQRWQPHALLNRRQSPVLRSQAQQDQLELRCARQRRSVPQSHPLLRQMGAWSPASAPAGVPLPLPLRMPRSGRTCSSSTNVPLFVAVQGTCGTIDRYCGKNCVSGPCKRKKSPKPSRKPSPKPSPRPAPKPSPRPAPKPFPRPAPKPSPRPSPKPSPKPSPRPSPRPSPKPSTITKESSARSCVGCRNLAARTPPSHPTLVVWLLGCLGCRATATTLPGACSALAPPLTAVPDEYYVKVGDEAVVQISCDAGTLIAGIDRPSYGSTAAGCNSTNSYRCGGSKSGCRETGRRQQGWGTERPACVWLGARSPSAPAPCCSIVAAACVGQPKCVLRSSADVYGDPCPAGTAKSLEVTYWCASDGRGVCCARGATDLTRPTDLYCSGAPLSGALCRSPSRPRRPLLLRSLPRHHHLDLHRAPRPLLGAVSSRLRKPRMHLAPARTPHCLATVARAGTPPAS